MSSNWIHLNLQLRNFDVLDKPLYSSCRPQEKPSGVYKELIGYLKKIVSILPGLINRYFYLFEPKPHLFLALELKDMKKLNLIKNKIKRVKKPNFIESAEIQLDTRDESNTEAAIDFFQEGTRYAFFRVGSSYKPGYAHNDETKLVHCFCNQLFFNWENEIDFYGRCLRYRGYSIEKWCKEAKRLL